MGGEVDLRRIRVVFSAAQVQARIDEIAAQVAAGRSGTRGGARLLLVVIAEGARRFAAALRAGLERRGIDCDELLVRARRTTGERLDPVEIEPFDAGACEGRETLVVDDIADEGRTLAAVIARISAGSPLRLATAVLVSKRARRATDVRLDHKGFEIDDGWVVGFGMDLAGRFRELDHLAVVEPPDPAS